MRVEGVELRDEGQVVRAVERQLDGVGPWSRPDDVTAADGLERALAEAGPWRALMAATLAANLRADDVARRTLAVFLSGAVANELGAGPFVAALTEAPARFAGVKPVGHPTNQPDLRWGLLVALGRAVTAADARALELLREAAHEPRGFWLFGALGRVDLPWLLANARALGVGRALGGTLLGLEGTSARVALVQALAPWTDEARREALDGPFWRQLDDADVVRAALSRA
jgi:hypothetical protein